MDESYRARQMEALDEPQRNALIAQADNVIDARAKWERRQARWSVATDGDDYA